MDTSYDLIGKDINKISNYWNDRIYKLLEKEWNSKLNNNISSAGIWIDRYNLN
jgi:hypothetical protein